MTARNGWKVDRDAIRTKADRNYFQQEAEGIISMDWEFVRATAMMLSINLHYMFSRRPSYLLVPKPGEPRDLS